ncbi:DUF397 domain-containing protein [Streptomyces sp. NPDC048845]|uniref:DUF397 domain-containing protein n=1 Tax=Streptomyces sp. NPDC048845 TaxID=3155390 RepID=UPI003425D3C4
MSTELTWFKSSYSGDEGGACVEVAHDRANAADGTVHVRDSKNPAGPSLALSRAAWTSFTPWFKSSYSGDEGGQCLEVAYGRVADEVVVRVRDSKNPGGPRLALSAPAWQAFTANLR